MAARKDFNRENEKELKERLEELKEGLNNLHFLHENQTSIIQQQFSLCEHQYELTNPEFEENELSHQLRGFISSIECVLELILEKQNLASERFSQLELVLNKCYKQIKEPEEITCYIESEE